MKYAADVMSLTAQPTDSERVNFAGFDAADERDAVRKAADQAAARIYGDDGRSAWIERDPDKPEKFLSFIGRGRFKPDGYQLIGVTVSIHVWTVE